MRTKPIYYGGAFCAIAVIINAFTAQASTHILAPTPHSLASPDNLSSGLQSPFSTAILAPDSKWNKSPLRPPILHSHELFLRHKLILDKKALIATAGYEEAIADTESIKPLPAPITPIDPTPPPSLQADANVAQRQEGDINAPLHPDYGFSGNISDGQHHEKSPYEQKHHDINRHNIDHGTNINHGTPWPLGKWSITEKTDNIASPYIYFPPFIRENPSFLKSCQHSLQIIDTHGNPVHLESPAHPNAKRPKHHGNITHEGQYTGGKPHHARKIHNQDNQEKGTNPSWRARCHINLDYGEWQGHDPLSTHHGKSTRHDRRRTGVNYRHNPYNKPHDSRHNGRHDSRPYPTAGELQTLADCDKYYAACEQIMLHYRLVRHDMINGQRTPLPNFRFLDGRGYISFIYQWEWEYIPVKSVKK